MKKRKKIGLALGSGGIRGLAHIGVIKKLIEHNIPIDYIAGSSIGAWIGAHYALFQDIEKLEEYTTGRNKEKMFSMLEPTASGGLIKGDKTQKLLSVWLNNAEFSDTKIPFAAVATDLISGQPFIFSEGNLARGVRASISVPTMFAPVTIMNALLIDGGVSNPVPDDVVKHMGADIVISVNLDNWAKNEPFPKKYHGRLPNIASRSLNIMRQNLARRSMVSSDIIVEPYTPAVGLTGITDFLTKHTDRVLIKNGAEEMEKYIPQLRELLDKNTFVETDNTDC